MATSAVSVTEKILPLNDSCKRQQSRGFASLPTLHEQYVYRVTKASYGRYIETEQTLFEAYATLENAS